MPFRTRTLFPAPGRLVRDPATGMPVPATGLAVRWEPDNPHKPFWIKALRDGDVLDTPPTPAPAAAPEPDPRRPAGEEE